MMFDRWFAMVQRIYRQRGGIEPIGDNENWRELHWLGYSPAQAVQTFIYDNY